MAYPTKPLVWIDCEMTGLNPDKDLILEIFCIITDGQLNPVTRGMGTDAVDARHPEYAEEDPGWGAIIHVPKDRLDQMDEWCTDHHGRSGLTAAVLESTVTHEEAADGLLAYIRRFIPKERVGLLAGSSVHADKAFLRVAPYDRVMDHLHYRILDVSTIKEAVARWAPDLSADTKDAKSKGKGKGKSKNKNEVQKPRKGGAHRARRDILDSIDEARYYKQLLFDGESA